MATATIRFVPSTSLGSPGSTVDQKTVVYWGTITFSAAADTYATGGLLALSGSALINLGPYSDRTPLQVRVFATDGSGWQFAWNTSAGKLLIYSGAAAADGTNAAVQVTNGTALNATTPTLSTAAISFKAIFPRV